MKKLLLIIALISFLGEVKAQSYVTSDSIYNFDVGDEFHYSTYSGGSSGACNKTKNQLINRRIISKNYSTLNDSVYYGVVDSIKESSWVYLGAPWENYTDSIYVKSHTLRYYLFDTIKSVITCDSISPYYDSTCSSQNGFTSCSQNDSLYVENDSCNDPLFVYNYSWGVQCTGVSGSYSSVTKYSNQLGVVKLDETDYDGSCATDSRTHLLYYKKTNGRESCSAPQYVSIKEIKNFITIDLYPNPAKDVLNINAEYKRYNSVKVIDALGKTVLFKKTNVKQLNVSSLRKGIYFIQLFNKSELIGVKQFVVED